MKNYQCKKCGTVIKSNNLPSVIGCPEGSTHQWINLGNVGDKNYQCRKCGTVVQSSSQPSLLGCPDSTAHQWIKL